MVDSQTKTRKHDDVMTALENFPPLFVRMLGIHTVMCVADETYFSHKTENATRICENAAALHSLYSKTSVERCLLASNKITIHHG